MWHIWPGRLWPASEASEAEFVAELERRSPRSSRATRDDVIALVSILRCGTTVEEALHFAPGLSPARLLGAHRRLETARAQAVEAWNLIAADPTPQVWRSQMRKAARLFPVAVERVVVGLESLSSDDRLVELVAQVDQRMREVTDIGRAIEQRCASVPPTLPHAAALAAALYNPHGPCVYADPFFVPNRVAALSATRVGDLLGESRV